MALLFLIAFIAIPIAEIALIIEIGSQIGVLATIAIIIATALAGSVILRWQGLRTFQRAQQSLQEGAFPLREVFDGACLLVAGVLLLTPGFFTDALGALLFVPFIRSLLALFVARHTHVVQARNESARAHHSGDIVDVDYEDVTADKSTSTERPTPVIELNTEHNKKP